MALQIIKQPADQLVYQNVASVTFSVSGIDSAKPSDPVNYQWRRKDTGVSTEYVNIAGATNPTLVLEPAEAYDNDTFVALVSGPSTENNPLSTNIVTFGIRLSGDIYSPWETLTESGTNRVRRLQALGYL
jgi:hypothetical protein